MTAIYFSVEVWLLLTILALCYATHTPSAAPTARPTRSPSSDDPELISFDFDCNNGYIKLTFDELVSVKTLEPSGITLQNGRTTSSEGIYESLRLSSVFNSLKKQGNATVVDFYLTSTDFALLKNFQSVGRSADTTFLAVAGGFVLSPFGQTSKEINSTSALQVTNYSPDETGPYLESYTLDMDKGLMTVTITEPVRAESFHLSGLQFQSDSSIINDNVEVFELIDEDAAVSSVSNLNRTLTVKLGSHNLNSIKALTGLAVSVDNTWLAGTFSFVNDTSNNPINLIGISPYFALGSTLYYPDVSRPTLLRWEFNLDLQGLVTLHFSETVRMSYFNFSGILFTNGLDESAANYSCSRVFSPFNVTNYNSHVVHLNLNLDQLNTVKRLKNLLTDPENSFVVLNEGIVIDTSLAQNAFDQIGANRSHPMKVSFFTGDFGSPYLSYFSIDMSKKLITLKFSETIIVSTIRLDALTLQAEPDDGIPTQILRLSSSLATILSTEDSPIIVVGLNDNAFSQLKSSSLLASSIDTTYLAMRPFFAFDDARPPNPVMEVFTGDALQAGEYIPDDENPQLVSWFPDFSMDQLHFLFSEPMNTTTMRIEELILSSDSTLIDTTEVYAITSNSYVLESDANNVVIQLSSFDVEQIKGSNLLCSSQNTCFLSFDSKFANDTTTYSMDGNAVQLPVLAISFLPPSAFIADSIPAMFLNYSLDMNERTLELSFSKPMRAQALNASGLYIKASNFNILTGIHQLSSFAYSRELEAKTFIVRLITIDYIRIKELNPLASSLVTSYLHVESSAIADTAGIPVNDTYGRNGLAVLPTEFVTDTTPPIVLAINIDSSRTNLTVYFDDVIDVSTVSLLSFRLISNSGNSRSLRSCTLLTKTDKSELVVDLSPIAVELSQNVIAQSQVSSFFYIDRAGGVEDVPNSNPIAAMTINGLVREGLRILSFRLDMDAEELLLEMSFTVEIANINPKLFTLQASDYQTMVGLSLFEAYHVDSFNRFITLKLSTFDSLQIVQRLQLRSREDIRLSLGISAIVDIDSKVLSSSVNLPCSLLVKDRRPLILESFVLNMQLGFLTLTFSKPVNVSSLSLNQKLLLLSSRNDSDGVLLSNVTLAIPSNTNNRNVLELSINNGEDLTDRDSILLKSAVGTSTTNTYLVVGAGLAYDLTFPPNPVQEIGRESAIQASAVVSDRQKPLLLDYTFDLNNRTMVMHFDEAINRTSARPNAIQFLQNPNDQTYFYTLAMSNILDTMSVSHYLTVSLAKSDVDNMMKLAPNLVTSKENTFIAYPANTFLDIASPPNGILVNFFRFGFPVTVYYPDITAPDIVEYNVSIQEGTVDFLFSEVVNCSATDTSKLTFQFREFTGTLQGETYNLTHSTVVDCFNYPNYDSRIRLDIGYEDLTNIKTFDLLLKNAIYAFLLVDEGAFVDSVGNPINTVSDGFALQPQQFTRDSASPRLLAFSVTDLAVLTLFFNEPVNVSSIQICEFYYINSRGAATKEYVWVDSIIRRVDNQLMELVIDLKEDYRRVTKDSTIFLLQNTTFLRLSSYAVQDTSGNRVEEANGLISLQIGPSVISWELDMNSGVIILTYSDSVNSSFSPADGIGVQDSRYETTNSFNLTTSSKVQAYSADNRQFYIVLSGEDVNTLKISGIVSSSNVFLTTVYGLTKSITTNNIIDNMDSVEISRDNALPLRKYATDTTKPVLLSFDLDIDNGILALNFDEPTIADSLLLPQITLVSSVTGSFANISNSERNVVLSNLTQLIVKLTEPDLNKIKLAYLAGDNALDYLLLNANGVQDLNDNFYAGNNINSPVLIDKFTPDVSPPVLQSVEFLLSNQVVAVEMDEYLDVDSIYPFNFYLLSSANFSNATLLRLSNYTLLEQRSPFSTIFLDLDFFRQDSFRLQLLQIATQIENAFLGMQFAVDLFGNIAADVQVQQAASLTLDDAPLRLESFDLFSISATHKRIIMYFSKVIRVSSFQCSDFSLLSDRSTMGDRLDLTGSICSLETVVDSHILSVLVPTSALGTVIGQSEASTYIAILQRGLTRDYRKNRLNPIFTGKALRVGPQVVRCSLNVNTGELVLVFSSEIEGTSLVSWSKFGLFSIISGRAHYLSSTYNNVMLSPFNGDELLANTTLGSVVLSPEDTNAVKRLNVSEGKFFLLVEEYAVFDFRNQSLAPRDNSNKLLISKIVADNTTPRILKVELDMGDDFLAITFDEPVLTKSVVVTNICLQGSISEGPQGTIYQLTGGITTVENTTLILKFTKDDAAAIKLFDNLAKSKNSSYISFDFRTISDLVGNYADAISSLQAVQVDTYTSDTKDPQLLAFTLDLSNDAASLLMMTFSEPVNATRFAFTNVTFQSRFLARDGVRYSLTGGKVISNVARNVSVQLSSDDIKAMKNIPGLIRRRQSTYLLMEAGVVTDTSGNPLAEIMDMFAVACTEYVADSTPATIISTTVDMNAQTVLFTMSEPINLTAVDVSSLRFQLAQFSPSTSTRLSTVSLVDQQLPLDTNVLISFGANDLNRLKSRIPLLTSRATSWISFSPSFMLDSSNNNIVPVSSGSPLQITTFVADSIPPTVVSYVLDMTHGQVRLSFSESVNPDTVRVDQLVLQSNLFRRFGEYIRLNDSRFTLGEDADSFNMVVYLSFNTLNYMKTKRIGISSITSYLEWSDIFVADNSGNYLMPSWDASINGFRPRSPDELIVDAQSPSFVRWYFFSDHLGQFKLRLYFDEPVTLLNTSSLVVYRTNRIGGRIAPETQQHPLSLPTILLPATAFNNNSELVVPLIDYCLSTQTIGACRETMLSLYQFLNNSGVSKTAEKTYFYLGVRFGSFVDFSPLKNVNADRLFGKSLLQSSPGTRYATLFPYLCITIIFCFVLDCSLCPSNHYVSKNCTGSSDRECSACSTCQYGYYTQQACSGYNDISCAGMRFTETASTFELQNL